MKVQWKTLFIGKIFEYTIDLESGLIDYDEDFKKMIVELYENKKAVHNVLLLFYKIICR